MAIVHQHSHSIEFDKDSALLNVLIGPTPQAAKAVFAHRDAALDPLLIAVAAASGPHVTRNHYHHDFFPAQILSASDPSKPLPEESTKQGRRGLTYVSRQAPRKQRLAIVDETKENGHLRETNPLKPTENLPLSPKKRRPSFLSPPPDVKPRQLPSSVPGYLPPPQPKPPSALVQVKCMARTRIPTPHGPAFLHLYHNNRDSKEHLAIVIDSAQLADPSDSSLFATPIRSQSLDAVWTPNETDMDRIVRGAYVGRLSSTSQSASKPSSHPCIPINRGSIPPPLIRIHSECFTGETVGSMRCDCGEQLDEAIRQISLPITIPPTPNTPQGTTIPGRGAVIYLRQEGRGIGLLSKIRAYNLQDMGHDTVSANLILGHKADERGYEIAGAILRDLGLAPSQPNLSSEGVRLLTNNPDKVQALEKEAVSVVQRVPMVPRSWQARQAGTAEEEAAAPGSGPFEAKGPRKAGATLIGGNVAHGEDLDKYLRTKVLRMGHILPLWIEGAIPSH